MGTLGVDFCIQRFFIEGSFPSLNEVIAAAKVRSNVTGWSSYASMKRNMEARVALAVRKHSIEPVKGPVSIRYRFVESDRRRDPSNIAAAAIKFIEDGLQREKILSGDGWSQIENFSVTWELGTEPGVHVTLVEEAK